MRDKHQDIEEPCEFNGSCTVLKSNGSRERVVDFTRSAHDAIEAIFNQIRYKSKFVLDADIAKCFDQINHDQLLSKLNTSPRLRRQIRAWLKADICDFEKHQKTPNQQGTPQGGVISPLLSNIALHGMEERIKQVKGASLIRYADDFVRHEARIVNGARAPAARRRAASLSP